MLSMVDWNLAGRSVNLLWQISVMVQHRKDFKTDGIKIEGVCRWVNLYSIFIFLGIFLKYVFWVFYMSSGKTFRGRL